MRTVITVSVDHYDVRGNLIGSLMGARASAAPVNPDAALEAVWAGLPLEWVQMTYDELVDHFAKTRPADATAWQQLTIF